MVTGVIASAASSGKRSRQKRWRGCGRNGSAASRHSLVGQQGRDLEDRRRQLRRQRPAAIAASARGGLGGQVDRPGRCARPIPAPRRRRRRSPRPAPRAAASRRPARRGSSRAGCRAAARAEVDLAPSAAASLGSVEVGPDPLQGIAVGVEEEAAVAAADEVDELRDRRLGLAVARAAGDVGEEGVGGADPDDPLAALAGDPAERDQVGPALLEARAASGGGGEQRPGAQDVLARRSGRSAASGSRPARAAVRIVSPRRPEKAGGEAAVEARRAAAECRSRGRRAPAIGSPEARRQLRSASGRRRPAGPASRPSPAAARRLRSAGGSAPRTAAPASRSFASSACADPAALDQLLGIGGRAAAALVSVRAPPKLATLAVAAPGLAVAAAAAARAARSPPSAAGRRRRSRRSPRLASKPGRSPRRRAGADRARAASRASGSTLGRASTSSVRSTARLAARIGSPSTSAAVAQLDPLVAAQRRAQQPRAVRSGTSEQVDEAALAVAVSRTRMALARRSTQPATLRSERGELGGEAEHGLGLRVELVGRARPRRAGAIGSVRRVAKKRCVASAAAIAIAPRARGAIEGQRREAIDPDARCEPPECEQHRSGEDREHRSWVRAIRVQITTTPRSDAEMSAKLGRRDRRSAAGSWRSPPV